MNHNFSSFLFIKQNLLAKLLALIACACFVGKGWGQTIFQKNNEATFLKKNKSKLRFFNNLSRRNQQLNMSKLNQLKFYVS
jgi:hypothetical protein